MASHLESGKGLGRLTRLTKPAWNALVKAARVGDEPATRAEHFRALEQRFDRLRELRRAQTVPGEGRAVRVDQELRHARLFLVVEIDDAVDFRQDAFDLRRQTTQHRQVRAEDLDREVRPAARDHVIDPVADRLAEADRNPGDRGDRAPHLGQKLLLLPA